MKLKLLTIAALAVASVSATVPTNAFAQSIATADNSIALARSKALGTAYQQISTQWQNNITRMNTLNTEVENLKRSFDTNKDNKIDAQEEAAANKNTTVLKQIQTKNAELDTLQQPIVLAQLYVIDQLLVKYNEAMRDVVAKNKIDVILNPGTYTFIKKNSDVTKKLTDSLNTIAPSVSIAVPANWRPAQQGTISIHKEVQQLIMSAAVQRARAQQAQQQPAAAQPSSR